jgi:signal transduction histidine kinase
MRPSCAKRRRLHRLYFRIYLTVLGVGLATVVAVGFVGWLFKEPPKDVSPSVRRAAEFVADGLPAQAGLEDALKDRGERLGLRLTLFDHSGHVLAHHGPILEGPSKDSHDGSWLHTPGGLGAVVRLDDGRWLAGAPSGRGHAKGAAWLVKVLIVLALAVAAGCWPIARRLTRRLEDLQRGVEELGTGDLSARVPVHGHDELADLASAFNRSASRIEDLVAAQKRVLASASHELRSPLARLRMALALIEEGVARVPLEEGIALVPLEDGDAEKVREVAADAAHDVSELDELVGDLLLASSLEARDRPLERTPVDLLGLVVEEARRADAEAGGSPVSLDANGPMLRRLLRNLLENASRYGEPPIEAKVEPTPDGARITVEDRGPGVPAPEREHIFEPFYRPGGHSEQRDGAVGLGLSLVREIAQAHGGSAVCVAREGGGSRFEVTLGAGGPPAS